MVHELDFEKMSKEVQDTVGQFALSFVSTDNHESYFQGWSQREQASSTEPLSRGGKVPCWQVLRALQGA